MLIATHFFVGLIFGSFLSVLLERLPVYVGRPNSKPGIIFGRSECPYCRTTLSWYDLLPLLSYILLRGHCRHCRARISVLYPLLELAMAAVFGLYAYRFGFVGIRSIADIVILFGLVSLFFFDLRHRILPDIIMIPIALTALGRIFLTSPELVRNAIMTGVSISLFLGLVYWLSHGRWLGLGDVKLAMLIGLLFGYPNAIGVTLAAIWAGALIGLILVLIGRANMRTALPFGSFWTLAAIVMILVPGLLGRLSEIFLLTFN